MAVAGQGELSSDLELKRLRTLYQLLAALTRARDADEIYEVAIAGLLAATSADRAAILMFDEDGVLRFKAWWGLSQDYREAVAGHTPWPEGAMDAEPIVVRDVLAEESLRAYRDVLLGERIGALVFIPLTLRNSVVGKLMLYYPEPHECSPDELEMAQAIAGHVSIATGRARAEFAKTISEQRLQTILDHTPTVIYLKDLHGKYVLANRRCQELFGMTKGDIVGRTDYEIFPSDMADRFRENDRKVLEAGAPISVEECAPHADGVHTYISIKFPFLGPDGKPAGVCGISTDITDRKQLDNASRRLAAIVESSDDAIVGKDLTGTITSWNKGAERLFGYTAEEAIGQPVAMLAAPDRRDEMPKLLNQIRRGIHVDHYETARMTKDGRIIQVSLTVSPLRDEEGRVVGASKIARDITGRKKAEEQSAWLLAREQEALGTAELLNGIGPRLASKLDPETLAQVVTDAAAALTGAEFGAFFHGPGNGNGDPYPLYSLSGASREVFAAFPISRIFRGEGVERCGDVTQEPGGGESAPLPGVCSYLAVPVATRSGELIGSLVLGHSLPARFTESHEKIVAGIAGQAAIAMDNARLFEQAGWVQAELKRSNEELRRANLDLETFAYSASHDLQEPLRTIAISAQLLDRSCGRNLQADETVFLGRILTAANRMGALLQDLLAYTKATNYAEGAPPSVDAGAVLWSVLEGCKGMLTEADASVTSEPLPAVYIHETRLAQLFQNLISNAVKYRGKEAPRVHITAAQKHGWTVFSVSDNGIGIETRHADQIFGLFKRLHGSDQYPGSGIGLAICQRIVEQYGGRIWLERSSPGSGSTFCFSIPSHGQ